MIAGARSPSWSVSGATRELPEGAVRAVTALAAAHPELLRDPAALLARRTSVPALDPVVRWIRSELDQGAGYAVVRGRALGLAYLRLAFGLVGTALGAPIQRYGFLYAVKDTGESHREKAIPISQTRAATGLHTDSSAADCVPGTVALACERPSLDGGVSVLADALGACRWIRQHRPDVDRILSGRFVRKIVTPGLDKGLDSLRRNRFPVVSWTPGFRFRYMRYWIEEGQRELGQPLGEDAIAAFDLLDEVLARPEFGAALRLERGDMLFVNNTQLAHGRTGYSAVPSGGRLLWRMWLDERAVAGDPAGTLDAAATPDPLSAPRP